MTTKNAAYPIADLSDFKAWALMEPNSHKLLREIVGRWRSSSMRVNGKPGKWIVYPRDRWLEWSGLSLGQLKRSMRRLRLDGLILSERHKFGGKDVRAFIQPTELALKYEGRPGDAARLTDPSVPSGKPGTVPFAAPTGVPTGDPAKGPALSLPFPSSPSSPSSPSVSEEAFAPVSAKGEGKDGGDLKVKKALKIKSSAKPVNSQTTLQGPSPEELAPLLDNDPDLEAHHAAYKAKQLAMALAKYPKIKGPHEKAVKHPSDWYQNWANWSEEKKAEKQALYESYVENWYAGSKGKSLQAHADWTEEDDASLNHKIKQWKEEEQEL